MTIDEILAEESKNMEFKIRRPEKSIKYMKSVVAFANSKSELQKASVKDVTKNVLLSWGILKKEGFSKIRNRSLANAFAYMNLVEAWGSGIPKLMQAMKDYNFVNQSL